MLLLWAGVGTPGPAAIYPDAIVEIAFGYTWQDPTPVWTDVTPWVNFNPGLTVKTGRSKELDSFQAGTCGFELVNNDRRFDPLNTSGPYYGQLLDRVPCRVHLTYNGTDYPLFRGFIEAWPQHYTTADVIATVPIVVSDAFTILAGLGSFAGGFTLDDPARGVLDEDRLAGPADGGGVIGELSGQRIDALLDVAGWPDLLRDVAPGSSTLQGQNIDEEMLAALQLVEASEDGFFYVRSDGYVIFHGRHDRQTVPRMAEVQAVFTDNPAGGGGGDDLLMLEGGGSLLLTDGSDLLLESSSAASVGGLVYDDLVILPSDWALVANDVRRTRQGGVEQTAVDAASIGVRGRRTNSLSGLIMETDAQAADLAQIHLERYSVPGTRIDGLVIDPVNDPGPMWPQVLGRQILDRIQVNRTPQQVGDPIELQLLIQGVEHTWQDWAWRTRWYVTPADDPSSFYFTLDDPTLGVLDDDLIGA